MKRLFILKLSLSSSIALLQFEIFVFSFDRYKIQKPRGMYGMRTTTNRTTIKPGNLFVFLFIATLLSDFFGQTNIWNGGVIV